MNIKVGDHLIGVKGIYGTQAMAQGYMREALRVELSDGITAEHLDALTQNPWQLVEGEETVGTCEGYNVLVHHEAVFAKVQTKQEEIAEAMRPVLDVLTDEQAIGFAEKYPTWDVGINYPVGARVYYNGDLYRVIQAHTSQGDWLPDVVPALYGKIAL